MIEQLKPRPNGAASTDPASVEGRLISQRVRPARSLLAMSSVACHTGLEELTSVDGEAWTRRDYQVA